VPESFMSSPECVLPIWRFFGVNKVSKKVPVSVKILPLLLVFTGWEWCWYLSSLTRDEMPNRPPRCLNTCGMAPGEAWVGVDSNH
jgi:hypothetical protein